MPDATTNKPVRISPALLGAGALVILLGFGLPALVSRPQAQPQPQAAQQPPAAATAAAEAFAPRPGAPAPFQAPTGNIGLALVRLVVSLAVVCGGCVFVVRYLGKKKNANAPDSSMTVVASLTVGRCAVHLVHAGERRMLIGTDASGVKALVELPSTDPTPEHVPNPFAIGVPEAHAA